MNIPVEEYNVEKLAAMCKAIKTEDDLQPCQAYIQQYFFHTFYGIYHFDVKHLNFVRIDDANIKQYLPTGLKGPVWLNPKWRARQWLVDDVFDRYAITMKLNAPPIDFDKKTINLMGRLKHGDVGSAKYADCSNQEKAAVELMLNHIKEVWCSSNEKQYEYVLTWLSCLGRRKVKSALYLQSLEQTGKTLVIEFLRKHVFGKTTVHMTDDIESISKYTQSFEGKILININEMPCVSTGQFKQIMNKLKTMVTDDTFFARAMYQQGRETANTFNFILTSNNDAIGVSTTNHKRYKMLDVSHARIGDYKYFDDLCDAAMNDQAGRAFFLWLKERFQQYGKYFNADKFPKTMAFKDKINERLNPLYKFIKFKLLKKMKGLDMPLPEICRQFQNSDYARECKREMSKIKISKELQQLKPVQFTRKDYTVNGTTTKCYFFKAGYKELFDEFTKNGWIHETDSIEFGNDIDDDLQVPSDDSSCSDSDSDEPPPEEVNPIIAALDRVHGVAENTNGPLDKMLYLGGASI